MRSSNGEVRIFNALTACGLPFQEEYEFPDLISSHGRRLRFDFCVFNADGSIRCLIEFQGKQHYLPVKAFGGEKGYHKQLANDRKKREYCLKNDYVLICIPYWEENKINTNSMARMLGIEREVSDGLRANRR